MHHYRFYSLDGDNRIVSARNMNCRDDLDALEAGEKASRLGSIEIWEGKRLVARIKQGNAPLDATDGACL
jgi:hypothetical protein